MLHSEMQVRLSFKISRTSGKARARRVHPVGTDLLNPLMDNPFAQAPAQLQAQVPAQSSRGSTMCVMPQIICENYSFFPHFLFRLSEETEYVIFWLIIWSAYLFMFHYYNILTFEMKHIFNQKNECGQLEFNAELISSGLKWWEGE